MIVHFEVLGLLIDANQTGEATTQSRKTQFTPTLRTAIFP